MRNPLAVAVFSLTIGVAIVFGCSAPSPDGTGLSRGRGSSSGSSGDERADDDSPSSAGASCTDHASVHDVPACDQCTRASCCEFVLACDKSPDCEAMMTCLEDCKDDLTCGLTCQIAHEKGGSILNDVGACARSKCKAECPSVQLDGGIDFDAF